jgi:hypothetical protein
LRVHSWSKGDSETDLSDDKKEFNPEGNSKDGVFPVMDTQALVLPADEDGTDDVSNDEDTKENAV